MPKEYWQNKINGNIKRDQEINSVLKEKGWKILRVWEKDIVIKKNMNKTLDKIIDFLRK